MGYRRFEEPQSGQLDRKSFKQCTQLANPPVRICLPSSRPRGVDGVRIKVGQRRDHGGPRVVLGSMGLRGRASAGPQHANGV
jgi:hypothetical protein